jgi:hypothetical protein
LLVSSKRGHSKSLALKTKDLHYRHFGALKMDKVELISNEQFTDIQASKRLNL